MFPVIHQEFVLSNIGQASSHPTILGSALGFFFCLVAKETGDVVYMFLHSRLRKQLVNTPGLSMLNFHFNSFCDGVIVAPWWVADVFVQYIDVMHADEL